MNLSQMKAVAQQFICHPASRSVDEIEAAGEAMALMCEALETFKEVMQYEDIRSFIGSELSRRADAKLKALEEL